MTALTIDAALERVLTRIDALENRLTGPCVPAEGDMIAMEIQLRTLRDAGFPADYFPDPMWTLLLDLYLAGFSGAGRTEMALELRLRVRPDQLQAMAERLIEDGYAEFVRDESVGGGQTQLRLTRLGNMTMQAVFGRTQGRIAELRAAA
jgi:hypothetical protein